MRTMGTAIGYFIRLPVADMRHADTWSEEVAKAKQSQVVDEATMAASNSNIPDKEKATTRAGAKKIKSPMEGKG